MVGVREEVLLEKEEEEEVEARKNRRKLNDRVVIEWSKKDKYFLYKGMDSNS